MDVKWTPVFSPAYLESALILPTKKGSVQLHPGSWSESKPNISSRKEAAATQESLITMGKAGVLGAPARCTNDVRVKHLRLMISSFVGEARL